MDAAARLREVVSRLITGVEATSSDGIKGWEKEKRRQQVMEEEEEEEEEEEQQQQAATAVDLSKEPIATINLNRKL